MDLHEIFSIVPQWANRYEVTRNLTQPHLPSFVMTYHDLATQLNQTFKSLPNLDWSPWNFQHRPTVSKHIWSDPKPDPTSPTLICHDLSWPTHPIKTNTYKSAKPFFLMRPEKQLYFSINNMKSTLNSFIKLKSGFMCSFDPRPENLASTPPPMPQNCPGEFCYPPGFQSAFKRLQDSRMQLI